MAPKRNTAASVCMDRLHIVMMRWSWTDDDFCGKQWKFAKYVAIPAPSKNTNTSINLLLHNFLHDHWVALWCQKFDSVMSGQSDANLRIIGIQCVNTESCSASHKWIALHCCVGAIRWLGVRARTVMPVRRWRTSADTQSLTRLQYMKKNTQANCTIHRPLLTHTVYTGNTYSIQTDYTQVSTEVQTDGPIHGALLTLGHWDNYQGSSHSIQPWVMWRLVGWNIDLFYSLECQ